LSHESLQGSENLPTGLKYKEHKRNAKNTRWIRQICNNTTSIVGIYITKPELRPIGKHQK